MHDAWCKILHYYVAMADQVVDDLLTSSAGQIYSHALFACIAACKVGAVITFAR